MDVGFNAWAIEEEIAKNIRAVEAILAENERDEEFIPKKDVHEALTSLLKISARQQGILRDLCYHERSRQAKRSFFKRLFRK